MYNENNAKWDVLEIVLMANDNSKNHEDYLNSMTEEEFEYHLKKCHMAKTLQRKVG